MPNLIPGHTYALAHLVAAYHADPPAEDGEDFLLYKGSDILALCLRYKFHPRMGEVWVGNNAAVVEWGKRLAALKDNKTLPFFYAERGRTLYTYKGDFLIAGDTDEPGELASRKSAGPLSRIVFLRAIQERPGNRFG
jgi:hypothetical protein